MNHKAECLQVIPIPNRSYFETRVLCVCGLEETFKPSSYFFESSVDSSMRSREFYPSDKDSEPKPNYLE
jgi:hypothetical protein